MENYNTTFTNIFELRKQCIMSKLELRTYLENVISDIKKTVEKDELPQPKLMNYIIENTYKCIIDGRDKCIIDLTYKKPYEHWLNKKLPRELLSEEGELWFKNRNFNIRYNYDCSYYSKTCDFKCICPKELSTRYVVLEWDFENETKHMNTDIFGFNAQTINKLSTLASKFYYMKKLFDDL